MSIFREQLPEIGARFEDAYPEDILSWAYDEFGRDLTMATGFGASGVALMHLASRVNPGASVFYLDTDLLFPETYELKRRLAERLRISFERVHSGISLQEQAATEGPNLWRSNPDRCCYLRKVEPLRNFLSTKSAWIAGIRRDQTASRAQIGIVEWDDLNDLVKINPLATWREEDVWSYVRIHDLPYNPLHDRGYPSVGCIPCTKPVQNGEDPRAGRWRGHAKVECGIHAVAEYRKSA